VVAVGMACSLCAACAPPGSPPYEVLVTRSVTTSGGQYTEVSGTIKNLTNVAMDYSIEMLSSSGEAATAWASYVLPNDTAIWTNFFTGAVNAGIVRVVAYGEPNAPPVNGSFAITRVAPSGNYTEIDGTVINTGPTASNFSIELQADSGEVEYAAASEVQPGQTATWSSFFDGAGVTIQWVRATAWS
jgi:hypothetical protein